MKYTIETRLYNKNNKDIIEYFDEIVNQYNYVFRKVYYIIRNNPKINVSSLNTELQNEYSISKRTAGSIIKTVQGRINSIKELKKTEIKQKEYKLEKIEEKLKYLIPKLSKIKFNKGFLAVSETNKYGHLVKTEKMDYRFGSGSKTENDLLTVINKLIKIAMSTGKDLTIEDLNFLKTKSKTMKGKSEKGKQYNKMLHSLAYRKFTDRTEQICNRRNVGLIKVNPAWTSWIAKNKYCDEMKLNIHNGAAFVIARRGMNIKEAI